MAKIRDKIVIKGGFVKTKIVFVSIHVFFFTVNIVKNHF